MEIPNSFPALVVSENAESSSSSSRPRVESSLAAICLADLDPGDVVINVEFSALNYKDALAARGHQGIAGKFPLIPGIDAVGTVVETESTDVAVGDQVLVAHAEFGTRHHGGFARYIRVPVQWVYRLPAGLGSTYRSDVGDSRIYGSTIGRTIAAPWNTP